MNSFSGSHKSIGTYAFFYSIIFTKQDRKENTCLSGPTDTTMALTLLSPSSLVFYPDLQRQLISREAQIHLPHNMP
jgi:hypothetical protein